MCQRISRIKKISSEEGHTFGEFQKFPERVPYQYTPLSIKNQNGTFTLSDSLKESDKCKKLFYNLLLTVFCEAKNSE